MKPARKTVTRRMTVKRAPSTLTLSRRIDQVEKEVLLLLKRAAAPSPRPRFVNLDANGNPTQGDHVAVYQTATDLIWTAAPVGTDLTQPGAMKAAADCRLLNASDWYGPTQHQLFSILDFEFWNPCVDPKHFKGPYGFTWSSTPYKGIAGYFRGVYLDSGNSDCSHQGVHYHALAVRAGQQLGLRI